jgi:hypothetical protein
MVAMPKFINSPGRRFMIFRQVSSWRANTGSSARAALTSTMTVQ